MCINNGQKQQRMLKEEENASAVLPEPEEPTTPTEDEDQTVDAVQVLKPSDIPSDRR